MPIEIPHSLKVEQEKLHEMLRKASAEPGEIGDVAKAVSKLMQPQFTKDENYALPLLGLLPDLARGKLTLAMKEVLTMTDKLKSELSQMLVEHELIVAELGKLSAVSKKANKMEYVELAKALTLRVQVEEEVIQPTAMLIGEFLREKLSLAHQLEHDQEEIMMDDVCQHDWDPKSDAVLRDQRKAYDEMRERCPVAHSEFMGWSLFRHEDISAVLADTGTYSNVSRYQAIPNGMDPPAHARYREALDACYSNEQMTRLEPRAREIAVNLIMPMLSAGKTEFMGEFATPFALKALCALLGWPEQQWKCLGGWVHGNQQAAFSRDPAAGVALASLFTEHVKINLDTHRNSLNRPANAMDVLLGVEVDGVRLDDEQIVSILRNWTAGQGTVAAGLGILVQHLAQEPELQEQLRSDPSLIPSAIEEILRVDDPLVANRRTTTRAVEIQGRTIPKGANLSLMWIAANRDPKVFDDPNAIKVERNVQANLVWGQGIHFCQGASLARLEMRLVLEELLSRTKHFEIVGDTPLRAVYPSNGLATLFLQVI